MGTVLITGVSGGLGAALFDAAYDRGDRVVALGRRFTDRQRDLAAEDPGRVTLHRVDLADLGAVPGRDTLVDLLGGATEVVLVHNAGVVQPIGAVAELDRDQLARAVAVNLGAVMVLTNEFLAATRQAERVHVLFVSSGAAAHVVEGWAAYCATKAGGDMFIKVLAAQVDGDPRVSVASVNPGVMDTPMQAAIRAAPAGYFPGRDRYVGLHDRGELPSPEQVARTLINDHFGPDRTGRNRGAGQK